MTYAVSNRHNQSGQYKPIHNKVGIDVFIKKFVKNSRTSDVAKNQKKCFVDKSVQKLANDSIIKGYFPKENVVREMAIQRVNKTLCVILIALITIAVVSYYFVLSSELELNKLSNQTVVLNNENEELQNKLDSLKSFSNVDKTLQKNNMLQKSGAVIETPEIKVEIPNNEVNTVSKKKIFSSPLGY